MDVVKIPSYMQQATFAETGGPEVVKCVTAPVPQPGEGQVLIKVAASGVNRPDCLQRAGLYPPPPGTSAIPGLEIAGTIIATGPSVSTKEIGREICALVSSGGYAEYAVADLPLCLPIPTGLSMIEAAGIPETYFTVYDNVFTRGRLVRGETILVHGGSSGIGSTAIQLAHAAGANVYTTAGNRQKCEFCLKLGAIGAINYQEQDFATSIRNLTEWKGIDVILDMVGGSYIAKNVSLLNNEGRLIQIAFLEASRAEIDFMPIMLKRLTITGSTMRARSVSLKTTIAERLYAEVWPLLETGKVKPIISHVFTLAEAKEAHSLMESGTHMGKIVLSMQP